MKNQLIHICVLLALNLPLRAQTTTFTNVASDMGIDYIYNTFAFGGGVSFFDFNNDGTDDLTFVSSTGENIYLYKNEGTFFTNVIDQSGIEDTMLSRSMLWLDYDNDGDKDLFIANFNSHNSLYRNDGNLTFTDVTEQAGISMTSLYTTSICAADYDNDGLLDIYTVSYSYSVPNFLYHNDGDGTFTNVTDQAGVGDTDRVPLAVVFLDYNNDGLQDIYIANDAQDGNTLFENNGDGTFANVSVQSGADIHFDAMGIAIGDYDNDFDLDMYISNKPQGNGLLRNNGDGTFTEIAALLGIQVKKTCWGVSFFDYDNDTDLDLFSAALGGPEGTNYGYQNDLFENLGNGTFQKAIGTGIDSDSSYSFGTATGDFNNDGYCDMAVMNVVPTKFELWRNNGGSNNWIKIKLEGTVSNRDAIGSIIEIYRGADKFIRSTHCGLSYLSQNSSVLTIGVGNVNIVDSVIIKWPSGLKNVLYDLPVNNYYPILETFGIVPVELTSFNAQISDGVVILDWSTATEQNNLGFEVERRAGGNFITIGFVNGFGTITEIHNYSYIDKNVNSGSYSYRLKQIDFNASFEYSDVVLVDVVAPTNFSLEQNYPNPFNPSTNITFSLAVDSEVNLKVFDVLGREVAHLISKNMVTGVHYIKFNAFNNNSGVYFYKLDAAGKDGTNFSTVKKMILTK